MKAAPNMTVVKRGYFFVRLGIHPMIALIAGLLSGAIGGALMFGLFVIGVLILGAILGLIAGEAISILI